MDSEIDLATNQLGEHPKVKWAPSSWCGKSPASSLSCFSASTANKVCLHLHRTAVSVRERDRLSRASNGQVLPVNEFAHTTAHDSPHTTVHSGIRLARGRFCPFLCFLAVFSRLISLLLNFVSQVFLLVPITCVCLSVVADCICQQHSTLVSAAFTNS